MKKLLFALVFTAFAGLLQAQPGDGRVPRMTVEERTARIHRVLDSAFQLTTAQKDLLDTAFTVFYRSQDKAREELMSGSGRPDEATRDALRAKMQEFNEARDNILKAVLSEGQYAIWKEKIEPSMRPQRGNRPPGGGQ